MPATLTTTPVATATSSEARKLWHSSWAMALGRIISALISSRPTTRIETTTVTAVSTASSRFSVSTGRPTARAYSGSLLTANSRRASSSEVSSTTPASTAKVTRSPSLVVVIAPNR